MWAEPDRQRTLEDHSVDFIDAALFLEGVVLDVKDWRSDDREPRFRALGRVGDDTFMVVYTGRGEGLRIISAWRVDDDGRRRYEAIRARNPQG